MKGEKEVLWTIALLIAFTNGAEFSLVCSRKSGENVLVRSKNVLGRSEQIFVQIHLI